MKGLIEKDRIRLLAWTPAKPIRLFPLVHRRHQGALWAHRIFTRYSLPAQRSHLAGQGMVPTTGSLKQEDSFPCFVSLCVNLYVRQRARARLCVWAREGNISCRHAWIYKAVSYISRFQSYQHL